MTDKTGEENKAPEEKAPKAPGVGDVAKQLIRDGKSNQEVLDAIKEQFPDNKTTMASVNWYRNRLRQDGENVPTARSLKAEASAEETAAKQAEKDRIKAEKAAARKAEADQRKADKAATKAAEKAEKDRLKAEAAATKKAEADAKAAAEAGASEKKEDFLS